LDDVLRALSKVLALRRFGTDTITLWIVAAGRPDHVFNELPSLQPLSTWPSGIYGLDRGLGIRLIVTSELPRTADTLLLRLLGARRTLHDALRELDQRPMDDALGRTARPIVVRLLTDVREKPASSPEQMEFVMETQEFYEKWQNDLLTQGEARGRAEGEARGRAEGEAKAIVTFLRARGITVPVEATARIESTADLATLERWLAKAATVSSIEELFE
jgi:hypothetical protein